MIRPLIITIDQRKLLFAPSSWWRYNVIHCHRFCFSRVCMHCYSITRNRRSKFSRTFGECTNHEKVVTSGGEGAMDTDRCCNSSDHFACILIKFYRTKSLLSHYDTHTYTVCASDIKKRCSVKHIYRQTHRKRGLYRETGWHTVRPQSTGILHPYSSRG